MKCKECNSKEFEYDDRLQQNSCVECGFIMVESPFEETVSVRLGQMGEDMRVSDKGTLGSLISGGGVESKHLRRAIRTTRSKKETKLYHRNNERQARFYSILKVLLSNYSTSDSSSIELIKQDILTYFRRLDTQHKLRGYSNDERAAALSYIVFREHGWPVSLHSISKHSDVPRKKVSKVAKTLAKVMGKSTVFTQVPFVSWCEREANILGGEEFGISAINIAPVMQKFYLDYGFSITRVQVATTLYMCSLLCGYKYTQNDIGNQVNACQVSIRENVKKVCKQLGIKRDDLLLMNLDDFINGAF